MKDEHSENYRATMRGLMLKLFSSQYLEISSCCVFFAHYPFFANSNQSQGRSLIRGYASTARTAKPNAISLI